ncbi:MAG: zinc-dependent metalloprotease [Chloroflexi bacterium]|nr:zinc-dependent metalloprotease [Chloroflexota bacterium]
MAGYRASFSTGLLIGAGAAAALALARVYSRSQADRRLVDWDRAARVAIRLSGVGGRMSEDEKATAQVDYEALVGGIEGPISQYTGTDLPLGTTRIQVMDRADWVQANISNFAELFSPLDEFYAETSDRSPFGLPIMDVAGRMFLSAQAGLLVGYLSRKVLGQYDISLLGKEPLSPGKLYFVEPNIKALEGALGVPPRELRLWIALHEATHAHEFEVSPWVRGYFNDHLEDYLRGVVDEARQEGASAIGPFISRTVANLRSGHNLMDAMTTPRQREILGELQALMTLAEGYSNHVMNSVGKRLLPHYDEVHERVEQRQKARGQAEELFLRLTGLKMKMEQYTLGEQFAAFIVQRRGMDVLNLAWSAPALLPTEAELRQPELWLARVEAPN